MTCVLFWLIKNVSCCHEIYASVYANDCAQVTSSCTSDPNKHFLELDQINALFITMRTLKLCNLQDALMVQRPLICQKVQIMVQMPLIFSCHDPFNVSVLDVFYLQ